MIKNLLMIGAGIILFANTLPANAFKVVESTTVTAIGCAVADGERVCFINLDQDVTEEDGSVVCGRASNPTQLRWYTRSANGEQNNGEEIFALAMLAYSNGVSVRLSHGVNGDCIDQVPSLRFIRLD